MTGELDFYVLKSHPRGNEGAIRLPWSGVSPGGGVRVSNKVDMGWQRLTEYQHDTDVHFIVSPAIQQPVLTSPKFFSWWIR